MFSEILGITAYDAEALQAWDCESRSFLRGLFGLNFLVIQISMRVFAFSLFLALLLFAGGCASHPHKYFASSRVSIDPSLGYAISSGTRVVFVQGGRFQRVGVWSRQLNKDTPGNP
jgi:hypothetical protein